MHKISEEEKRILMEISEMKRTVVFYESPHRIMKTLNSLKKYVGDRKVVIAREISKIYEQVISGTPTEVEKYFLDNEDKIRGEFVVLVSEK